MNPTRSFIVGTAGHIDHGKTALVRMLTGIDTDRLKEEKRRGITIELGFAHLDTEDIHFGIVDVPGHERFIKSMVAGAGGVDLVLLVVAADEGVMPQTREHLDICQLLGVRRGLVALTKADLVDPDWLALVVDDLTATLDETFLAGAPIIPCSAIEGRGADEICRALRALVSDLPQRDAAGLLRLPIDRVFTVKGFGTVVTGTLLSGQLAAGEMVAVLPSEVTAPVRRLQVHGETVQQAVAGQRTAINLGGVDRDAVARGEVVARPHTLAPSRMLDVRLSLLPTVGRPLKVRSKVLFHLGTRQQEGTCVLLDGLRDGLRDGPDGARLLPGGNALAQLRFDQGVVALPGDRFILRGFVKQDNYGTTIGGGEVIRVLAPKLRPRDAEAIALLRRMSEAETDQRLELEVLAAGPRGIELLDLQRRLPLTPRSLRKRVDALLSRGVMTRFCRETGAVAHREVVERLRERVLEIVDRHHRDHPLRPGISTAELRSRLQTIADPRLGDATLKRLAHDGQLALERDICRRPEHRSQVEASIGPTADRICRHCLDAGLAPPREAEVVQADPDAKAATAAIHLLLGQGRLVRVKDFLFHPQPLGALEERLRAFLRDQPDITPSQFKELVGQSRKYTIPLAEHFDSQGVTVRRGDTRQLR